MQKEHPIDRFMRRMRGPILWAFVISGPIMLASYGWMIKHLLETAPAWVSVPVVISHVMGWIAIGSLFDRQQERRSRLERGQF